MGIRQLIQNFFKKKESIEPEKGQLFFIGNKRSGTTILAEKINIHPDIYITHETDIIWILYSLYNGKPFEYYDKDEPHSTVVTREKCSHILEGFEHLTPLECYQKCQDYLMKNGTQWIKPTEKIPLVLGDKKPNQHSEIYINDWVHSCFPNTRYVHIVRHPFDFLNSVPRLLPKYDLGARYGSSKCKDPMVILKTWACFEELVIQEKKRNRFQIHSLKFEDFCEQPAQELEKIWKFCGTPIPPDLQDRIDAGDTFGIKAGGLNSDSMNNRFELAVPPEIKRIMDIYHYSCSSL